MAKRKRENADSAAPSSVSKNRKQDKTPIGATATQPPQSAAAVEDGSPVIIQIVTGSYERVLHGIAATVPQDVSDSAEDASKVEFSDTFLFNAHASAIRSIAISPPSSTGKQQRVTLASGGTDQRINLYHLSTAPPSSKNKPALPTLGGTTILENPRNKELGSLLHHSSSISALYFPTSGKLLSASEDNTIAIARTSDWTVLSIIKAPIPKAAGRPSGDTAAPGEVPAGINDFAVHPSMKLMVSVGRGERSMRLWNLVTGKKAGVLNFDKDMLQQVGEGKWGTGEGRKVVWDAEGEEFTVGFERGTVVYGMDSKPKARILPSPLTKIHQIRYVPELSANPILAISTEDGRILFYSTQETFQDDSRPSKPKEKQSKSEMLPSCRLVGELGGPPVGIAGRVKDFDILTTGGPESASRIVITGSSDGAVRLWAVRLAELRRNGPNNTADSSASDGTTAKTSNETSTAKQIGQLIGTYETGNRITCLKAFVMIGKSEEVEDEPEQEEKEKDESSDSEDSD